MGTVWGKGADVEVYNFDGEVWLQAVVLQPDYDIDGYAYLQLRVTDRRHLIPRDDIPSMIWMPPELVEQFVRAAEGEKGNEMGLDLHEMDIKVMARKLLRDLVYSDYAGEQWGDSYPEIDEHDWLAILEQAKEIVDDLDPDAQVSTAAYARLERAAIEPFDESSVTRTL